MAEWFLYDEKHNRVVVFNDSREVLEDLHSMLADKQDYIVCDAGKLAWYMLTHAE